MKTVVNPDPKPDGRVRDPELLRELHLEWRECALCRKTDNGLSLHHISKHPRDDVRGNLAMLCGSGTTGCHGLIEFRDPETLKILGRYILSARGDTIAYLYERMGAVAAQEFMKRHLLV
jgi:hypothetical protein